MPPATPTLHVIFKTHLDLGFTDLAANVRQAYLEQYIPAAMQLARHFRENGESARFVWTTGSWLVWTFLEEAAPAQRRQMEAAIAAGDIAWHALPFTVHSELLDPPLMRFGLSLSQQLDRRFGRTTIAAKMTDVPGHTRGLVPRLAEAGVRFLHLGVNPASPPPAVPTMFRWQADSAEVIVNYAASYGDRTDVPGLDDHLVFAHTGDNQGPQSADAVRQFFAELAGRFPDATIRASTLDTFARAVLPLTDTLPIVTAEIGDTWIHGAGTDPAKMARYRALRRVYARHPGDRRLQACAAHLLCIPEHTWGMDEKTWLGDYVNYTRADFAAARQRDLADAPAPADCAAFAVHVHHARRPRTWSGFAASWSEQRAYADAALAAIADPALRTEAEAELAGTVPHRLDPGQGVPIAIGSPIQVGEWRLAVGPDGAMISAVDADGQDWASPEHPLARFTYQTFSQDDYDRWLRDYTVHLDQTGFWAIPDFSKPGMAAANPPSASHTAQAARGVRLGDCLIVELTMPTAAVDQGGCPRCVQLRITPAEAGTLAIDLHWFDKAANRLPEAMWLAFNPRGVDPASWRLHKLGQWVSPLDVVAGGNRLLHAVEDTIRADTLAIDTLDAALVAPGAPRLLHHDNRQPDLAGGLHFCLYNNLWGTNFPMWYEDDGVARFRLSRRQRSR